MQAMAKFAEHHGGVPVTICWRAPGPDLRRGAD
jgi:hypothetical protein